MAVIVIVESVEDMSNDDFKLVLKMIHFDMNERCNSYEEKINYLEFLINELEEIITDINIFPWDYN